MSLLAREILNYESVSLRFFSLLKSLDQNSATQVEGMSYLGWRATRKLMILASLWKKICQIGALSSPTLLVHLLCECSCCYYSCRCRYCSYIPKNRLPQTNTMTAIVMTNSSSRNTSSFLADKTMFRIVAVRVIVQFRLSSLIQCQRTSCASLLGSK